MGLVLAIVVALTLGYLAGLVSFKVRTRWCGVCGAVKSCPNCAGWAAFAAPAGAVAVDRVDRADRVRWPGQEAERRWTRTGAGGQETA